MMKTPEGWSWEWVERAKKGDFSGRQYVKDIIREAQAEAVAETREECARICEQLHDEDGHNPAMWAARKIRATDSAAEREATPEDG